MTVTFDEFSSRIEEAMRDSASYVRRTPIVRATEIIGSIAPPNCYLKLESLQVTGSFKYRGARNAIEDLTDIGRRKGIIARSSGNHAKALSHIANSFGIAADFIVAVGAPQVKVAAIKENGGIVHLAEPNEEAQNQLCKAIADLKERKQIDSSGYEPVIFGQGTVGLEILDQIPDCDMIVVPVSGGGLLSGILTAVKKTKPKIKVIGVEPEGANDLQRSLSSDHITPIKGGGKSISEGLLTTVKPINFDIARDLLDEVVTVTDAEIAFVTQQARKVSNIKIEPSGMVALTAAIHRKFKMNGTVCLLVTGGNIDQSRYLELESIFGTEPTY